jgi:hypothetical protein
MGDTVWLLTEPELRAGIAIQLQEIERLRIDLAAERARAEKAEQEAAGLRDLLREAADMLLAGAALMPDEMMCQWEGMRGMVERIAELDIDREAARAGGGQ